MCVPAIAAGPASEGASQLLQLGPRRVPPARLVAHRGFPPPGDELCVELCADRWSTGLVPSALRLCGVLRAGANVKQQMNLRASGDPRYGGWTHGLVPPARHGAHRGFHPLDGYSVELCSDRWSTGLVPSALRLCGVLRAGANAKRQTILRRTLVATT